MDSIAAIFRKEGCRNIWARPMLTFSLQLDKYKNNPLHLKKTMSSRACQSHEQMMLIKNAVNLCFKSKTVFLNVFKQT